MLNDAHRFLICGALDHQLTNEQRDELRTLLADSPEARALYLKLRSDRRRIRRLPRQLAPAGMVDAVMRRVATQRIIELPKPTPRRAYRFASWLTFAAAAVVILGLLFVSLELAGMRSGRPARVPLAKIERRVASPTPPAVPESLPQTSFPSVAAGQGTGGGLTTPMVGASERAPVVADDKPALPPISAAEGIEALAAPYDRLLHLFTVEMPRLPPIIPVSSLGNAARRAQLAEGIRGQRVTHIDLFCRDANAAFEQMSGILEKSGRKVLIDPLAQRRLQAKLKTDFVLLSDWDSVDELVDFLKSLANADRSETRRVFDSIVPVPLSDSNLRTLAALLGIDVKSIMPAMPPATDPKKPLSDATLEDLTKALEKSGNEKASRRSALAMSFNPVRPNPMKSREIREFLANRLHGRPESVLAVVLIRNLD